MKAIDFEQFIKVNYLRKIDLAQYMGVSPSFITKILKGEAQLPADKLRKIIDHPEWDTSPLLGRAQEEKPAYHNPLNLPPTAKPSSVPTLAPVEDGDVIEAEVVELPIVPTSVVRQPETRLSKWLDKYSDEVERLRLSEIISGATMVREVKEKDMCPDLKVGQYIYLEKMAKETPIKNGHIYFVDHSKLGGFFRKLFDRGEEIECRTARANYGTNIIRKEDIYDIYQVVGVFSTDIIEDSESALKDQQIALLTEQLNRLMVQQEQHTNNTAEALASTNRAIEQIDKMTSQQGKLIEALVNKQDK
jgi:transcriptional regulator with XRE-family HTH domain